MAPLRETMTCTNLPKRDELRLRTVSALPKASSNGLVATSRRPNSMDDFDAPCCASTFSRETYARWRSTYLREHARRVQPAPPDAERSERRPTYLHVSVLPEPEGPETTIDWDSPVWQSRRYMRSAMAKTCGGSAPMARCR